MAGNMELICKRCFPQATRVTDRFHVQKLATEALQEMRIKYRWEAMDAENEAIEQAKKTGRPFQAEVLHNGDTIKQLLARSRYVVRKIVLNSYLKGFLILEQPMGSAWG